MHVHVWSVLRGVGAQSKNKMEPWNLVWDLTNGIADGNTDYRSKIP